jgi:hypothetical protein
MNCLICNGISRFSFAKEFALHNLGRVEYWSCDGCGFTLSRTHAQMPPSDWERLNQDSHAGYFGTDSDPGDPRWRTRLAAQAALLDDAASVGLLDPQGRWLDYACGDGKLANLLLDIHGRELLKYDRYLFRDSGYLSDDALQTGGFDLVVTTSVFEHLWQRDQFDAVHALVSDTGVLGIHTLVCETVPRDPAWFYLASVHCAFHTNRSMALLLSQWGYTCSVYGVAAQLWLCFKADPGKIESLVHAANARGSKPAYVFKRGFVDYWKSNPMQRSPGAGAPDRT